MGIALSGGGYRAMLFHLGSLWRLNEVGILGRTKRISSVSGGSIIAGLLAVRWNRLKFEDGLAANFGDEIAQPTLAFAERTVDVPSILAGLIPRVSSSKVLALFFRMFLVGKSSLQDLPDEPRFVFNATHLASATAWRFSKPYMGTYRVGLVRNPTIAVADAIAASAAFPPFLSPFTLRTDPSSFEQTEGADLYPREDLRRDVALSDGGVYDNLGVETVWRRYETVLVSDGGSGLDVKADSFRGFSTQVRRVIDTATAQAGALRRRALVAELRAERKKGALWRVGTDLDDFPVRIKIQVCPGWRDLLATIPTRLSPPGNRLERYLVNWGYIIADAAIRSYIQQADAPTALPFPNCDFARDPGRG